MSTEVLDDPFDEGVVEAKVFSVMYATVVDFFVSP